MKSPLRNTGLDVIGDVPWGTHFCQFYQTKDDLIDILVPYFKAGLENNEFCIWVTAEPLTKREAEEALAKTVPGLARYKAKGQIEVIPYTEWYLKDGRFDSTRVLDGWVAKHNRALARGYEGLRLTGNTIRLEKKDWRAFTDYEEEINRVIGRYRMIAICTYSLEKCGASEVIDVVNNHQFALIRRGTNWEIMESAENKKARELLQKEKDFSEMLINSSKDGILAFDNNFRYTVWNAGMERISGKTKDEVIGKCAFDIFPFLKGIGEDKIWCHTLKGHTTEVKDRSYTVPETGREGFFEGFYAPIRDAAGNVLGGLSIIRDVTGRKQAEDALRQTRDYLEKLFNYANAPIICWDAKFRITRFNHAFEHLAGYMAEEVIGRNLSMLFHKTSRKESLSAIRRTLSGEHWEGVEIPILRKDGEIRMVLWNSANIYLEDGKTLLATIAQGQDITGRKKMEDKLAWLASFPELNPNPVVEIDFSGRVHYLNPAAKKILPDLQQLGGRHPLLADLVCIRNSFARGGKKTVDREIQNGDYWFQQIFQYVPSIRRIRIYSIDITERRQAEQALEYSEQRYALAQKAAYIGTWDWDIPRNKLTWSEIMELMFGFKRGEFGGDYEAFLDRVHPSDRTSVKDAVIASIKGIADYSIEYRIILPDDTVRWISGTGAVMRDENGTAVRMIGTAQDITEHRKAEEILTLDKDTSEGLVKERTQELVAAQLALEKAKRLSDIGSLAATVAHELRNPLAAISMASSNIRRKAQNPLLASHLDNIEKKIYESDQIINNLLFYSRIKSPHYEHVDIGSILKECVASAKERFPHAKASVRVRGKDLKGIAIKADPLQMRELFNNILNNAYDALPRSGARIEIDADATPERIAIAIRDNGCGIDREHLEKIFDPFFTTKAKGTGLGLAVCYQIATQHRGALTIRSTTRRGTTVSVTLPRDE